MPWVPLEYYVFEAQWKVSCAFTHSTDREGMYRCSDTLTWGIQYNTYNALKRCHLTGACTLYIEALAGRHWLQEMGYTHFRYSLQHARMAMDHEMKCARDSLIFFDQEEVRNITNRTNMTNRINVLLDLTLCLMMKGGTLHAPSKWHSI